MSIRRFGPWARGFILNGSGVVWEFVVVWVNVKLRLIVALLVIGLLNLRRIRGKLIARRWLSVLIVA